MQHKNAEQCLRHLYHKTQYNYIIFDIPILQELYLSFILITPVPGECSGTPSIFSMPLAVSFDVKSLSSYAVRVTQLYINSFAALFVYIF
jgi:hypothetical protein